MKFQLERIALFSDAVFAIAITLMILEIKVPHLEHGISFAKALEKFLELLPTFVGTFLSFYLIGVFWQKHHELMKYMGAYNPKVLSMNIGFLLSIAFLPFSTAFVFENIESGSPLPLLVYNINYIAATVLNYRLFIYILDSKNNLRSEHDSGDIITLKRELLFPLFVYVFVIVLAFIKTDFAGIGYLAFALEKYWVRRGNAPAVVAEAAAETQVSSDK